MNSKISIVLTVVISSLAGFVGGWFFTKKKYSILADRQIKSMIVAQKDHDTWLKDMWTSEKKQKPKTTIAAIVPSTVGPDEDRLDAEKKVKDSNASVPNLNKSANQDKTSIISTADDEKTKVAYTKFAQAYKSDEKEMPRKTLKETGNPKVYVISPQEFNDGNNSIETLYYYEDGVIADADGNQIRNFKDLIGDDWYHFGQYEADSVYIRNENNGIDYELLLCSQKWADIASPAQKTNIMINAGDKNDHDSERD